MIFLPPTTDLGAFSYPQYSEERSIRLFDQANLPHGNDSAGATIDATSTILERYFGDKWQIFAQLAQCESGGRQFDAEGETITSLENDNGSYDHGYLQINNANILEAYERGLNVLGDLEDNIHMAAIIYQRQGYQAWAICAEKLGLFTFTPNTDLSRK